MGGAWVGLMSMPCANGRVSQAMAEGRDKGAIYHNGRESGKRRWKWGGCWHDCLARVAGVRWWGAWCVHLAKVGGMRWWGTWHMYLFDQGWRHKVGVAKMLGWREAGGSGEGMGMGDCGVWGCGTVMDGDNAED